MSEHDVRVASDLAARIDRATSAWVPGAAVDGLEPMAGGSSGLTYRVWLRRPGLEPVEAVVKVAPPGLAPVRNRDVLRQARLVRALGSDSSVPVPEVLFEDAGDPGPSDRPPLFAASFVAGESFEPIIDPCDGPLPEPATIAGRAVDAARVLASLHCVDPSSLGLAGEPVLDLADELARWTAAFATVEDGLRPRCDDLHDALELRLPQQGPPAVVHGDFRLGNTLCVGTEVRAVIDWEIWALTDARIDLAWFLMFCRRPDQPSAVREAPGMPDAETLQQTYEDALGRPVADLQWFHAFVRYKQAATIALLVKRRRRAALARDEAPGPVSPTPGLLIARGLELLDRVPGADDGN